jgi:predicted ferric reductase
MLVLLGSQINGDQVDNPARFYIVATIIVILIFASLAINFKRLNFTWPHLMLPVIYLLGVGSVFIILNSRT